MADSLDEEYRDLIEAVTDAIGRRWLDTYVVSFCESGDLLSQWRGYSPDNGYAIEFDTEEVALATRGAWQEFGILDQVAYGREDGRTLAS